MKYNVVKCSSFSGDKYKITVSSHRKWERAWRAAHRMNEQATKNFKEGRYMYDVPEYRVEENAE